MAPEDWPGDRRLGEDQDGEDDDDALVDGHDRADYGYGPTLKRRRSTERRSCYIGRRVRRR